MAPPHNAPAAPAGVATETLPPSDVEIAGLFESKGPAAPFVPPRPRTLAETGLSPTSLPDVVLKLMPFSTMPPAYEIATRLRLDYECLHQVMSQRANNSYIQSIGQAPRPERHLETLEEGLAYMITESGRERAREILDRNQHMRPAPVPLREYNEAVRQQGLPENFATRDALKKTLKGLVLSDETLEVLGPAFNSRSSVFLYGHPGNGKSSISRAAQTLLGGSVYMPYALAGEYAVRPLNAPRHREPVGPPVAEADQRWVRCKRPFVQVGGELDLSMLDL